MPSIKSLKAFNFQAWIEENKEKFKPPVGNAQVWEDGEMMVTVVGGPNNRRDYHDDPTEEFFYQLKGNIFLRIMETPGKPPLEIPIKEGEIFLLPKCRSICGILPSDCRKAASAWLSKCLAPRARWMGSSGTARIVINCCIARK